MSSVMSRLGWKAIDVEIHLAPAKAIDTVAPIRMAMAGPIKETDSHMIPHSGWMQTVTASVITQMDIKLTVVPTT